jgi:hypothetical protein
VLLEINEHISERMAVSLKSLQHLKLEFLAKQGQQGKGMEGEWDLVFACSGFYSYPPKR